MLALILISAGNYYFADEDYDNGGNSNLVDKNGGFKDYNLSDYGEYGLIVKFTVLDLFIIKT